jgi:hypothetical protein
MGTMDRKEGGKAWFLSGKRFKFIANLICRGNVH